MMKKYFITLLALTILMSVSAQDGNIGVNTQNPEAKLDVVSSNSGILIPRIALTATNIMAPVYGATVSELIYNTASAGSGNTAVFPGFYYWSGSEWIRMKVGSEGEAHDWYEIGTTSAPGDISDNIFTNGQVGINVTGFSNSLANLHVAATNNPHILIEDKGDATAGFSLNFNDFNIATSIQDISFRTGVTTNGNFNTTGTERMTIKPSSGNVGIGTNVPITRLDVNGIVTVNSGTAGAPVAGYQGAGQRLVLWPEGTDVSYGMGIAGSTMWSAVPSFAAHKWYTGTTERMQIASSGNVGIGTSTPGTKLDVSGDTRTSGDFIGRIAVEDTRNVDAAPTTYDQEVHFEFKNRTAIGVGGSGTFGGTMTFAPWSTNSGDANHQLHFNEGGVFWRQGQPDAAAWGSWEQLAMISDLQEDADWYQVGTTTAPSSINDNIYTQGKVGIGTTTPTVALEVKSDDYTNGQLLVNPVSTFGVDAAMTLRGARNASITSNQAQLRFENYDNDLAASNTLGRITGNVSNATTNVGDMVFYNSPDGTTLTETMRMTSGSNVGIGTSTPSATLDVVGSLQLDLAGTETAGHVLTTDASGNASWSANLPDNDNGYIWNQEASAQTGADFWIDGNGTMDGTLKLNSGDGTDKIYLTSGGATGSQINTNTGWTVEYQAGPGNSGTTGEHAFFTTEGGVYKEQMTIISNGNVGIGDGSPSAALNVVGVVRGSYESSETNYTEMGHGGSNAYINYAGAGNLDFRSSGTNAFTMESDGDLSMLSDNSVKMPNNLVWTTGNGSFTCSSAAACAGYIGATNTDTGPMVLESGNIVHVTVTGMARFTSGSNTDDLSFRVNMEKTSTGGCSTQITGSTYGPWRLDEDGAEHDNFRTFAFQDIFQVSCNATYKFRLYTLLSGDDPWEIQDVKIVAVKY